MGFSDLGCYGSEIQTPNLDKLSSNGVRFTNFYNTARCWPTRASLMTGYYAQQVRRDSFAKSDKGSQGQRPTWAPMLPDLLKPAGYRSYHSGKWHLDGEPMENGFDHSYQLLDDNRHFAPNRHRLDGQDLAKVGLKDGYYATHAITDRMLSFLSDHQSSHRQQPFFGYVAYIAPHFPLHAPAETIEKYKTMYHAGWDKTRQARFERQTQIGLNVSPAAADLEPEIGPPYAFPKAIEQLGAGEVNRELPWDSLNEQQKSFQAIFECYLE
ncbi:MAG: sulfatase-like hydrolase/transferase [Chitinophagaceae bacterium]|nr:sulfatase-like hydrolase/transferase [Chitinophagaceae bacterium]